MDQVAEGVKTTDGAHELARRHGVDTPIINEIYAGLYEGKDIPPPRVSRPADAENDPHSLRVLRQHGLYDAEIPEEVIVRARRAYYGSVSYIDDQVGAVMDALQRTQFLTHLSGRVFLTQHQAVQQLKPDEIEPYIP